jgi:hypothetical protein
VRAARGPCRTGARRGGCRSGRPAVDQASSGRCSQGCRGSGLESGSSSGVDFGLVRFCHRRSSIQFARVSDRLGAAEDETGGAVAARSGGCVHGHGGYAGACGKGAKMALFQPAQATKGNENRQIETTCYCECSSISLYLSTARTSGKDFRQAWAGGASGNSSVRLAACGGLQTMAAAAARCPEGGDAVNSTHRPGLATRKSSDVNGRAQSPHRPVAGVKRHDARRARPTQSATNSVSDRTDWCPSRAPASAAPKRPAAFEIPFER